MEDEICFSETITSARTEALFIALAVLCGALYIGRINSYRMDFLAGVFLVLCLFFLFYSINYRTLSICLTRRALKLKFGIFTWTEPYENIAGCSIDPVSGLKRYGGAGIHFMLVQKRYRASFNFLEYPRVVVALKRKSGPVCDLSFSTRQPEKVLQKINASI